MRSNDGSAARRARPATAALRTLDPAGDGVLYCNDGDWVESCTALVEDHEGKLAILRLSAADAHGTAAPDLVVGVAGRGPR